MKSFAIFDFDGTLFDSVNDVMICLNEALSMHGFPTLSHDEYVRRLGGNINEIVSLVLKDNSTDENIETVRESYDVIYDASPKDKTVPFDGMEDVLLNLQDQGITLAINSNRSEDSIRHFTDSFWPDINFALIEGPNPAYPSKPSPCGIERMQRKFNVTGDEQIYIGDSFTDIQTAKNAQIDCLIVKWGYGFKEDYEDGYPLEIIEDASEILKYF